MIKIGSLAGIVGTGGSLLSQYLTATAKQAAAAEPRSAMNSTGGSLTFDGLRSQLQRLGNRLIRLRDAGELSVLRVAGITAPALGDPGAGEGETQPPQIISRSFAINLGAANMPKQFSRQVFGSFERGFSSADDRIINSNRFSGELNFTIGEGEDSVSFAIAVSKKTSVQEFVDQFNSQAQGKATANLENQGTESEPLYRVVFDTTIGTPAPDPEIPPPPPLTMGRGPLSLGSLEADAANLARDLKAFVDNFNRLEKEVNSSLDIASGRAGEELLGQIRDVVDEARSDDGSVAAGSFLRTKNDGRLEFNGAEFSRLFVENSGGVGEAIRQLVTAVTGSDGVIREYAGYGGRLDQFAEAEKLELYNRSMADLSSMKTGLGDAEESAARFDNVLQRLSSGTKFIGGL